MLSSDKRAVWTATFHGELIALDRSTGAVLYSTGAVFPGENSSPPNTHAPSIVSSKGALGGDELIVMFDGQLFRVATPPLSHSAIPTPAPPPPTPAPQVPIQMEACRSPNCFECEWETVPRGCSNGVMRTCSEDGQTLIETNFNATTDPSCTGKHLSVNRFQLNQCNVNPDLSSFVLLVCPPH